MRTKHLRAVGWCQMIQHTYNWSLRRKRTNQKELFEEMIAENFQNTERYQSTDPRISENCNQDHSILNTHTITQRVCT
jgi:hypothetical protein